MSRSTDRYAEGLWEALGSADPHASLRAHVTELLAGGASRDDLIAALDPIRLALEDRDDAEEPADAALRVMDALAGWTRPEMRL